MRQRGISRRLAVSGMTAGALLGASEALSLEGRQLVAAGALELFGTLDDLAKGNPAHSQEFVFVTGAIRPGVGGAIYRRTARQPFHAAKVLSADGSWWELVPGDLVNVLQFGAVGDGHHDDSAAIQSALDYAIYSEGAPKKVFLPALPYLLGEVLHVGYGDRFVTVEIWGERSAQRVRGKLPGLYSRVSDRPCINIQGGRGVRLRDLALFGLNLDYIQKRYEFLADRGRRGEWAGPALGPNSDDRHAPYAGIAVDAYAGPSPPKPYPNVSYPSFVEVKAQYNKNYSSGLILENCLVEGFYVGVAVQPGLVPDASNGDFISYRDCSFNLNVVAIADGHSDSRCNNIENVRLHFNHTAIDTTSFGPGTGVFIGQISGCSFDNNWQVLNINIGGSNVQGGFPLNFYGCYGESLYHLGSVYTSGKGVSGISFDGCKFQFSTRNEELSPEYLISCRAGLLAFRNCVFQGGLGFVHFDANVELDSVAFSRLERDVFDTSTVAGRIAKSFTGGIWANAFVHVRLLPSAFFDFSGEVLDFVQIVGLDSQAFSIAKDASSNSSGRPIPHWVKMLDDEGSLFPVGHMPALTLDRSAENVAISNFRGIEYDLTLPRSWLSRLDRQGLSASFLIGPGDIVEDCDARIFAYVVKLEFVANSDADPRITLRQLTRVGPADASRAWKLETPMSPSRGLLRFHNARRFYPYSKRAVLETQRSKMTVRLSVRETIGTQAAQTCFVFRGDFIAASRFGSAPNERLFDGARVLDVGAGSGTITLDSRSVRDFWGDTTLFVKGNL